MARTGDVGCRDGPRAIDIDRCIVNGNRGRLLPVPFSGSGQQLSTSEAKLTARDGSCTAPHRATAKYIPISATDPTQKGTPSPTSSSCPWERDGGRATAATATSSLSSSSVSKPTPFCQEWAREDEEREMRTRKNHSGGTVERESGDWDWEREEREER